jgi:hypothetical protein
MAALLLKQFMYRLLQVCALNLTCAGVTSVKGGGRSGGGPGHHVRSLPPFFEADLDPSIHRLFGIGEGSRHASAAAGAGTKRGGKSRQGAAEQSDRTQEKAHVQV